MDNDGLLGLTALVILIAVILFILEQSGVINIW